MATGKSIGLLNIVFGANLKGFNRAMKKARMSMKRFGANMKRVGASMTTNMTMPLLAIGAAGVKLAAQFGSSMTKIRTLVGASSAELKSYEGDVKSLSATTGQSAEELANGLFFITSAGFKGKDAIEALEISAKGAAMQMGEMTDIATALTSVVSAYEKQGMTSAKAGDLLHETLKQGKFEAGEFMQKLGKVVPTAAAAGIEFEELGAAAATMSKLSGDAAGTLTSMNSLMMKLLNPSAQQTEILEELGIGYDDLSKMLDDSLMGTLEFLFKGLEGNNDMLLKVFGSSKAVTGALSTMGLQSETYKEVLDSMYDSTGNVSKGFDILATDTGFKFTKAFNNVKLVLMDIGTQIMPLVLKAVNKLEEGMAWWQGLDQKAKTLITTLATVAFALGPSLAIIGGLATLLAGLLSPIGLVVAAILAIVVAFAYVRENWEAFKERLGDWGWWKNALLQALAWVIEYSPISLLIKGFNELAKFLGREPMKNPFEAVSDGLEDLMVETKEYENEFGSFKEAMINQAKELDDALNISGFLESFFLSTGKKTGGGGDEEEEEFPIIGMREKAFETYKEYLEYLASLIESTEGTVKSLSDIWNDFWDDWGEKIAEAIKKVKMIMSSLSGLISAVNTKEQAEFDIWRESQEEKTDILDGQMERELERVEESGMSDKDKADAKIAIEERYAEKKGAIDDMIDKKEKALKRKQAIRDKAMAIVSAIISTAEAIMGAVAASPLTGGLPWSALVAALGAAQILTIASTPIPFAQGGLVSGPTLGLIGEGSGTSAFNPEVVSPLDKLMGMMGTSNVNVHGRIQGDNIVLVSDKAEISRERFI
jgi:TP901 family phage tail tape measure protein